MTIRDTSRDSDVIKGRVPVQSVVINDRILVLHVFFMCINYIIIKH